MANAIQRNHSFKPNEPSQTIKDSKLINNKVSRIWKHNKTEQTPMVHADVTMNLANNLPFKSSLTYFLGHGNGARLVNPVLEGLGWKRITDRNVDVKFRWTECSAYVDYRNFKEGEQMVNHIPNNGVLTNKLGLLFTLREFERRSVLNGRTVELKMDSFFPQTFNTDDRKEREAFVLTQRENPFQTWICKPAGSNQGKGIYLIRNMNEWKAKMEARDIQARSRVTGLPCIIVQKYLPNPLLLHGRKFDIRCYMLIANVMPFLVLYHPGYVRLAVTAYSLDDTNLLTHLTNQFMQKKEPNYESVKNDTVWSIDHLNDYINRHYRDEKKLPNDWAKTTLQCNIQRIVRHLILAARTRLATRTGMFELFGLDFMLDDNMELWLLEVNTNPALGTHCEVLQQVLPDLIEKSIYVCMECFEKSRINKPLLPLTGVPSSLIASSVHSSNRDACSAPAQPPGWFSSGRLGVPDGFSIVYQEKRTACESRWTTVRTHPLRRWICPRYLPLVWRPIECSPPEAVTSQLCQDTTSRGSDKAIVDKSPYCTADTESAIYHLLNIRANVMSKQSCNINSNENTYTTIAINPLLSKGNTTSLCDRDNGSAEHPSNESSEFISTTDYKREPVQSQLMDYCQATLPEDIVRHQTQPVQIIDVDTNDPDEEFWPTDLIGSLTPKEALIRHHIIHHKTS